MSTECEICGTVHNLDQHHVIPKRMGGRDDPAIDDPTNLMTICRGCHQKIHRGTWTIQRSPEVLRVMETKSGDQVMRRHYDQGMDPPTVLNLLNVAEESMSAVLRSIPYLSDDQLVEVFGYLRSIGKRSWLIQAAVLHETQERSIYGDRSLEAIARRFEMSQRQAQKYALVWKAFFHDQDEKENVNVDALLLDEASWYVVAATETKEPEKWLAYAQDRKMEEARYSVSSFRRDIQQANVSKGPYYPDSAQSGSMMPTPLPTLERRECPWVKPFCTRTGRPVPVEDCTGCEFTGMAHQALD